MSSEENLIKAAIEHFHKYAGTIEADELELILKLAQFSTYKKGDLIHNCGEIPRTASFIINGACRSYYIDEDGKENTVGFYFEYEPAFPYGSFVEQVPATSSFMAMEPTEMVYINRHDFYHLLQSFPRFEVVLAKLLGEYLVKGGQHLKLMRIDSSRERYKKLLEIQPEIVNRVPLTYIASYLGMALETLSRVRAGKL
jgi:CRP-like cAMP-binding protein